MLLNEQGFSPLTESGGLLVPTYMTRAKLKGRIKPQIIRRSGLVEDVPMSKNGVTVLGFNLMLDSTFRELSATLYPYFFIGLIGSTGWTGGGLQSSDTASSHSSWAEDSTHYTPTTVVGAINNSGGYTSGTTTTTIDGFSAAISNGTPFTITGLGGTYTILSTTGGSTPTAMTFTPGLAGSVADDAVINVGQGRPIWTPGAASGQSTSNSSSVNFPINTDNTVIKGIFVITDPTLGGTGGLLWSSGLFSADQTLFNGDILKITYTVSLS